jgi:hypothetical protein
MQLEQVGPPPASVSAASVVPAPLPAERFDFSSDRAPTDQVMAENDVTKQQLEEGNDPAFSPALEARAAADKHEAGIEARYRQAESKIQGNALGAAQHALAQGLDGMHGARKTRIEEVIKQQHGTKSKNANERKAITDKITDIKNDTLNRVKLTLSFLETMAPIIFDNGLRRAETAYNDAFKEAKGGLAERAWDWATKWRSSWDEHIQNLLNAAKKAYDKEVRRAIDEVADFVEAQLTYARRWVEVGLEKIEEFVRDLEPGLKTFGANAARAVRADFEAMVTDIDHRAEGLIDKLSEQYKASHQRMSEMEEKLRQENKSLWDRVYDATVGLIKKIIAFKDMLLDILGRAVSVIVDIIAHPIRFLETLVSAVGDGLNNFIAKIDVYLQQGIIAWLFGQGGLRLPDKFDLPGVSSIVLQILHIDSAYFRARAVTLVGERVVATLEHGAEVFKIVKAEGIPGLQRLAQQHLTDLKSMVLDAIWGFIKNSVIAAGIKWILKLLTPASAFFAACKAIYDIVAFLINRASQLKDLVNAVIDSLAAIAKGDASSAASRVEGALVKAIPVAIGFLASLLDLGDPAATVRSIVDKARSVVDKAIDAVINLALKGVKAAGKLIAGAFGRKKEPAEVEDSSDPKVIAAQEIDARMAETTTVNDAEKIVSDVRTRLAPIGLHELIVRKNPDESGYQILAAASDLTKLFELKPVFEGKSVQLAASITMREGSPTTAIQDLGTAYEEKSEEEITRGRKQALFASPAQAGLTKVGGMVLLPKAGEPTLDIVTWNTGEGVTGTNVSHAENQFVAWLRRQDKDKWLPRVLAINVVVSNSPCGNCSDILAGVNKIAGLPSTVEKRISWQKPHRGVLATTAKDIITLTRAFWIIDPSSPMPEGAPNEEERARIMKAERAPLPPPKVRRPKVPAE